MTPTIETPGRAPETRSAQCLPLPEHSACLPAREEDVTYVERAVCVQNRPNPAPSVCLQAPPLQSVSKSRSDSPRPTPFPRECPRCTWGERRGLTRHLTRVTRSVPSAPHPNCRNRAVCGSGGLRTSVWASVRFIEGEAGDRRAVDGSGRDGRAGQEGVSGVVCGVI